MFSSVLMPWVPVFSKGSMDAFLIKNILPKLQVAIANWDINPSRQELGLFNCAIDCHILFTFLTLFNNT
jgi:hypothetical protein